MNNYSKSRIMYLALIVTIFIGLTGFIAFFVIPLFMQQKTQSENELVNYVLSKSHEGTNPKTEELFVYSAKNSNYSPGSEFTIDHNKPLKVWLYKDGKLNKQMDLQNTIQEYLRDFSLVTPLHSYTYFTILSISADGNNALIAIEYTCGPTCGEGRINTMKRDKAGHWQVIDTEITWIS